MPASRTAAPSALEIELQRLADDHPRHYQGPVLACPLCFKPALVPFGTMDGAPAAGEPISLGSMVTTGRPDERVAAA